MQLMDVAQLLGNIGDFLGAIAVVATLAYLAKQIHSSTEATKALVRQGITDFSLRYISLPLDTPKLSVAYTKWRARELVTDEEAELLIRYQSMNFAGMEGVYYCYSLGFLDESEWQAYENRIKSLLATNEFARRMWERSGSTNSAAKNWPSGFGSRVNAIYDEVRSRGEGIDTL
jgi:hypothetical protein